MTLCECGNKKQYGDIMCSRCFKIETIVKKNKMTMANRVPKKIRRKSLKLTIKSNMPKLGITQKQKNYI